jgi:hypothetical protein
VDGLATVIGQQAIGAQAEGLHQARSVVTFGLALAFRRLRGRRCRLLAARRFRKSYLKGLQASSPSVSVATSANVSKPRAIFFPCMSLSSKAMVSIICFYYPFRLGFSGEFVDSNPWHRGRHGDHKAPFAGLEGACADRRTNSAPATRAENSPFGIVAPGSGWRRSTVVKLPQTRFKYSRENSLHLTTIYNSLFRG